MWPFSRKIADDTESKSLAALQEFLAAAGATSSKIAVTPTKALECVPVRAAVQLRCETLSSLPLRLYRRLEDGGKEKATDHPLYGLLHGRANGWTSSSDFVSSLERDSLLTGHGYALANRVGEGRPAELIRLAPDRVKVELGDGDEPTYVVSLKGGGQRPYHWRDVLHVSSFDGLSAVRQAREAIGIYSALEAHTGRIMSNGGRPSGILTSPKKISEPVLARLKESWSKGHAGEASGNTAILEDGMGFSPLTFSSVDLQFAELRAYQLVEIARAFAVPPVLIADFSRATWGNFDAAAQAYLSFCLLPRIRSWSGAIARLLSPDEQKELGAEFDTNGLVQADIAKRFQAYASAISSRILNPNEVRELENRGPYDGGNEYLNPNTTSGTAAAPQNRGAAGSLTPRNSSEAAA
ncbi:MAG: phage portal protein [Bosea sp.]|uniref:phage portal protein n=1 Tax=Bosea sp. (in: a-proteobacteria) TaxID=1871050 RepID=UPI001AC5279D|nr:phage portal protein [Bosea sp. (in: a-proteobacteria)]MBN9471885.1 phage portal protein [Bosea sp. (in: a-proteobacteria)]